VPAQLSREIGKLTSHFSHESLASFTRFDILLDDLDTVPVSTLQQTTAKKQLQFLLDDSEGIFS
jgi:M-phase phosphoprotein 9